MSYDIRRDNKGRKLLNGESQRKDGMYEYKYLDNAGKRKSVYSWKLTASDPLPPSRKACVPLREKEKQIQKDLYEGLRYEGGDITVLELVKNMLTRKEACVITPKPIIIL
ncbi:site-specific recombinase XerD [Firmicutes bacterium CAG:882]|jgi:hypothetical protein|nr:site-specific recombinase XerD [Firmicutes bacterium CAG:882]